MRVTFLGNWAYPYTTETHIARSFEAAGATVVRLQEPPPPGYVHARPPTTLTEIEAHGGLSDLFLWMRTWGSLDDAGLVRALRAMEANGTATATWSLDLYVGIEREAMIDVRAPQWATQWVFTADGDPATQRLMDARGVNHRWMPPAVVADECVEGVWAPGRWPHDVVFVGSSRYHVEWPWRQQLLAWMHATYGDRAYRYGNDTTVVRGLDLNSLYRTVPAVVGDSLCPPGKFRYWSDRIAETLGRGGTLIFPEVPGVRETYGLVGGVHCLFYPYGNLAAIGDYVEWLLANRDDGRRIAEAGQAQIRAAHTYTHRVRDALTIMGLADASPDPTRSTSTPGDDHVRR